jgi:hypothetical protein
VTGASGTSEVGVVEAAAGAYELGVVEGAAEVDGTGQVAVLLLVGPQPVAAMAEMASADRTANAGFFIFLLLLLLKPGKDSGGVKTSAGRQQIDVRPRRSQPDMRCHLHVGCVGFRIFRQNSAE